MRHQKYQNYFEDEVLSAHPFRLIQLLYEGALDSIRSSRRYLRAGDIRARSRAISKAMAIVTELALSVDVAKGGEVSRNLVDLYAYIEKLLIQANVEQSGAPLEEADRLLATLLEAWKSCAPPESKAATHPSGTVLEHETYEPISCAY
jgi:flagellar secretion chaperone FliS